MASLAVAWQGRASCGEGPLDPQLGWLGDARTHEKQPLVWGPPHSPPPWLPLSWTLQDGTPSPELLA